MWTSKCLPFLKVSFLLRMQRKVLSKLGSRAAEVEVAGSIPDHSGCISTETIVKKNRVRRSI